MIKYTKKFITYSGAEAYMKEAIRKGRRASIKYHKYSDKPHWVTVR